MLEIKNVSKSFGNKEVIKDLSLKVEAGSIFGLVGVNGAGKSTLLRIIAGVYEPDGGSVLFDGKNTLTSFGVRSKISFVSEETNFPFGATMEALRGTYENFYDFDRKRYKELLAIFGVDEKAVVNNLSKGMKRRVSLVFALSTKPSLLLLDEAYDGLEPLARYKLKIILADLVADGTTVVISGHNLRELEDICDSFGILDGGNFKESGDLISAKSELNKYQIAYEDEKERDYFENMGFDILRFEREGQVVQMVVKGSQDEIESALSATCPLLLNVLPVNFEELFIYEVEGGDDNVG